MAGRVAEVGSSAIRGFVVCGTCATTGGNRFARVSRVSTWRAGLYYAGKRLVDLAGSSFLLLLGLPLMAAIALAIKLTSSGPVIFTQPRIRARHLHRNGHRCWQLDQFTFYKFRTMAIDAQSQVHEEYMRAFITDDRHGLSHHSNGDMNKMTDDPRVTPVGRFLRKFSLDELPQLWNVFKGDMSLVGPRPPIPYEVEMYDQRHLVRLSGPVGLTGLWQVSGRAHTTFEDMVNLDIAYNDRRSLWFDLKILFETIPAVVSRKGAA